MAGEGPVVDGQPGFLVAAGDEAADDGAGRPAGRLGVGQGTAHLEQLPPPGEPEAVGQGVVDLRRAEDPEVDGAAAVLGGVL